MFLYDRHFSIQQILPVYAHFISLASHLHKLHSPCLVHDARDTAGSSNWELSRFATKYAPSLIHLNLSDTAVTDLLPVGLCTCLQTLNLAHTDVDDVAPLAACVALVELDLSSTKIWSVRSLGFCKSLTKLQLRHTGSMFCGRVECVL